MNLLPPLLHRKAMFLFYICFGKFIILSVYVNGYMDYSCEYDGLDSVSY